MDLVDSWDRFVLAGSSAVQMDLLLLGEQLGLQQESWERFFLAGRSPVGRTTSSPI